MFQDATKVCRTLGIEYHLASVFDLWYEDHGDLKNYVAGVFPPGGEPADKWCMGHVYGPFFHGARLTDAGAEHCYCIHLCDRWSTFA